MPLYQKLYSITLAALIIIGAALFIVCAKFDSIDAEGQFQLIQSAESERQKQVQQQTTKQTGQQNTAQQQGQVLTAAEQKVSTKAYFYGASLIASKSSDTITYYHGDQLSSVRLQSDATAKKVFSSRMQPFGSDVYVSGSSAGNENNYKFTEQEQDAQLYYYGARYYDTKTGRFTQIDPVLTGASPYAYTENNPLRFSDPGGASVWDTVKNNWRPVATGLAIGTVAYNAARGENVFSETSGKAAAGVLALDVATAFAYYVGDAGVRGKRAEYGSRPSEYRLSYDDIRPYEEFIRNSGINGAEDVADALKERAEHGLVFSSTLRMRNGEIADELVPIPGIVAGYVDPGVKGYIYGSTVMNVVFYPRQEPFTNSPYFEDTLGYIAHEGEHLTQSGFKTAFREFFGVPYNSPFDFIERPAYDFQYKVLLKYREQEKQRHYVDSPGVSGLDAMNSA